MIKIRKPKYFWAMSSLLGVAVLLILTIAGVVAQERQEIRIGWQPAEEVRFYAAKNLGLFEKEGLDAKYHYFAAGPPQFSAFASKSIDIGYMWLAPIVIGSAQGIDWKIIMVEGDSPECEGLVVRADSGIKTGYDLKGKTIAVTKGTSADYAFGKILEKFNIKRSEVKVLDVLPMNMGPAFEKKDVDGIYVWEPWLHNLALKGGRIIMTDKDVDVPGTGLWLAHREFIEKSPKALYRFLAALDNATQHLKNDPAPAVNEIVTRLSVDLTTAQYIYKKTYTPSYKEQLDPAYALSLFPSSHLGKTLKEMAVFLKETGRINTVPNVEQMFDRNPLQNYLQKK